MLVPLRVVLSLFALSVCACHGAAEDASPTPRYAITDLGTLGGNASVANAVNERGQVTGTSDTSDGRQHAFLYSGGR